MKKLLFGLVLVAGGSACFLLMGAAQPDDIIRPNTTVGPVAVGGMSPEDAAKAVRVWWETEKLQPLKVSCALVSGKLPDMKPGDLGVTIDDAATIRALPLVPSGATPDQVPEEEKHPLVFKANGAPLDLLRKTVRAGIGGNRPAHIFYRGSTIWRKPEVSGADLDLAALPAAVALAVTGDGKVALPLTQGAKHVSDDALNSIKEVVSQFSTRFPARNRPRCSNIALAASKIDGLVLLPGERFSFNGSVGRRTLEAGFKLAGVYKNGQHDTGVGGGICQVSTTLYNSALFANLKITSRSNHSLPVPYVPLGRDATVDYGNIDLGFENTYTTPIAVAAKYTPGRLTFWVLGQKQKGLSVKVQGTGFRAWSVAAQQVTDGTLPAGKTRVVREGSTGRSISTFRFVFQNGKLVRKEPLGFSRYGGDARVIAVGKAAAPVISAQSGTTPPPVPVAPSGSNIQR